MKTALFYSSKKNADIFATLKLKKVFSFLLAVFAITSLLWSGNAKAQTLPAGFSQVLVANGISSPTVMAFAPDGRIFVAQQTGQLRIIKNGTLLATPFISLSVNSSGERGLLGIAFDPAFNTNHFIYLYYTLASGANNRISRFTANGDVVVAGSEVVVLNLDPLSSATNHNGGTIQFGPDGKLYVGVGENANPPNAQNLDTYLGKVLRINSDGSVPAGNPFTTGSAQRQRVWSYGLRNPYTVTFQPGTGRFFIDDVGQSTWEEINDATTGGKNYGWPNAEGNSSNPAYTNPVYQYGHGTGSTLGCAITGGTFFNPASTNYPASYIGKYFFIDLCGNWINVLTLSGSTATNAVFATGIAGSPVSIVTGNDGNLYFLSITNGAVYKIVYTPVITTLNPAADAFVRSGSFSTTNYGSNTTLSTKNATGANATYQTYLRFNISSLSANLSSVKLRLFGSLNNTNSPSATVQLFNVVSQTWQESTITYSNKPAADATVLASATVAGITDKYYEWDLTQYIISRKNAGATSVSILVKNSTVTTNDRVVFNSKENAANKPQLVATANAARPALERPEIVQANHAIAFSAYPNPAINSFKIRYSPEFQNTKLKVIDITGKLVKELLLTGIGSQNIITNDLKQGFYILSIEKGNSKYAQKILIGK